MGKTRRCNLEDRDARRGQRPAPDRKAAEELLESDARWGQLHKPLRGVLRVSAEWDDAFIDLDHLCSLRCSLIIDLHRRFDPTSSNTDPETPPETRSLKVLRAAAKLIAWAERMRRWDDLSLRFWTRVLCSWSSVLIARWVRFVKANGVHVLLRVPVKEIPQQSAALEAFLCEQEPTGCATLPVSVGFEFCSPSWWNLGAATFSADDMKWLHELLRRVQANCADKRGAPTPRNEKLTMGALLFHISLHESELSALGCILEDPATIPIRGLGLSSYRPPPLFRFSPTTYMAALRRVFATAFTSKGPHDTSGVSLALDCVRPFAFEYVNALYEALQNATRPLRMLSLAEAKVIDVDAAKQLGRLLFSPPGVVGNGCEINISGVQLEEGHRFDNAFHQNVLAGLAELVEETVARSQREGARVECQCFTLDVFEDKALTRMLAIKLNPDQYYAVVSDSGDGSIGLAVPAVDSASQDTVGWVRANAVSCVRTADGRSLVGSIFTAVVADHYGSLVVPLIQVAGRRLQRLALRKRASRGIFRIVEGCVNLQELNVSIAGYFCGVKRRIEGCPLARLPSSLRALDLSGSELTATELMSLAELDRLRYLVIADNRYVRSAEGPGILLQFVRALPHLRYVDVGRDLDASYRLKLQLDAFRCIHVPVATTIAFLSVLTRLERRNPRLKHVAEDAIVSILQYGSGTSWPVVNGHK